MRFADPNKQLSNGKSVYKFLKHGLSKQEIDRFITFLGIEILSFIKQCPLKFVWSYMMINKSWWKIAV